METTAQMMWRYSVVHERRRDIVTVESPVFLGTYLGLTLVVTHPVACVVTKLRGGGGGGSFNPSPCPVILSLALSLPSATSTKWHP